MTRKPARRLQQDGTVPAGPSRRGSGDGTQMTKTFAKDIDLEELRAFAERLAEAAGEVALSYFHKHVEVELKSDQSPVTVADRETERFIRAAITERYPDHDILGEEYGAGDTTAGCAFKWVVDPIDGTKAFIAGVPLYTTLIALLYDGEPVIGVIRNGVLRETVSAAVGHGCTMNGTPCRVSREASLENARLNVTDYASLSRKLPAFVDRILPLVRSANTWADAYGYLLVATGRADIMMDPAMSLWDIAPLRPIITEAGGSFTDLDGSDSGTGTSALATNGLLHDRLLQMLRGSI